MWRGDVPLSEAFWNWAVIGGLVINLLTSALFLALIMNDRVVAALIAGYGFSVPYNLFVMVGVWRSAARYEGDRRWADLARIVAIAGLALLSVT